MDNSSDISFPEAIQSMVLNLVADIMHTAMPGIIESYDSETRKAKVTPQIKKKYLNGDELEYQPIENVPVVYFGTSNSGLRLPEDDFTGETCLLVFCERSLDVWKSKGELSLPGNNRKFSTSDGVAIVGLNSFNNTDRGGNDLELYAHGNTIAIKENGDIELNGGNKITIKSNGDIEIGSSQLKALVTDEIITSLTTEVIPVSGSQAGPYPITAFIDTTTTKVKAQ